MARHAVEYGYTRELAGATFDQAIGRITEALKAEGFGVLTRIDVHDTLKQKIGVDFRKMVILGACNPKLAHQALSAELGVGLLLPCNVTVFEGDAGQPVVQVIKPAAMLGVVQAPGLEGLAGDADERLRRALDKA